MSPYPHALRASLRLRFAIVGAIALLLLGTSGIVAASAPAAGPFTGCLAAKSVSGTPATKGQIYNIAQSATSPSAPCNSGDTLITFSNAQGLTGLVGPRGATGATGPTGPVGPVGPKGDTGSVGPSGPAGTPGGPGQNGASLTAEPLSGEGSGCGAAGGYEIFRNPPSPLAPVSLGLLCNGAAGARGPKGDPGTTGPTGPQGPAGGALANLNDLNGIGCSKGSDPGTVEASVDATSGEVSILCIPTGAGGGGGTHTNTLVIGDCRWDDASVDNADVPASNPGFTGGCLNGTPVQTPLTNFVLNDCQWDDGSENPNDKPDPVISDGFLIIYTCTNGVLGSVVTPAP